MEDASIAASSDRASVLCNEMMIDRVRAAFEAQSLNSLVYSGTLHERNLYHITRMVASAPNCLQLHVRRIFLAIRCRNRAAAIGALIDLNLVLQGRGWGLFERLVKQVIRLLGGNLKNTLERTLLSGDSRRVLSLPLDHSVLANGRSGTLFHV